MGTLTYGNIYLGQRSGAAAGQLALAEGGIHWRRTGGGRTVEVPTADIEAIVWNKLPKWCQLGVRRKDKSTINFLGLKEKDLQQLQGFTKTHFKKEVQMVAMATAGRNWGKLALNGSSLMFLQGSKPAFEIPLPEVSQVQPGKEGVMLEFNVDDTVVGEREDALAEIAFHIPDSNPDFKDPAADQGDEDEQALAENGAAVPKQINAPSKVFFDAINNYTDGGSGGSDEVVCIFEDVHILAPRGRMEVEMHMQLLKLQGQAQDFKIRYSSVARLFVLPRPNSPHTLVVVTLDPPIRKGQTFYPHILCQFPSDEEIVIDLQLSDEQIAKKNNENAARLNQQMSGPTFEVFAQVLRGMCGAKLTRQSKSFKSRDGQCAVRCVFKADDGYLYPLEKAFFYGPKPPILVPHEEIESVEFQRQGIGAVSISSRTFDISIRLRNEQEYVFRSILKQEWDPMLKFLQDKSIRIENLASAQMGPAGRVSGVAGIDIGEDLDPGMIVAKGEGGDSEASDGDFNLQDQEQEEGLKADDDFGEDSDEDDDDDEAELVDEEGINASELIGAASKRKASDMAQGAGGSRGDGGGVKKDEDDFADNEQEADDYDDDLDGGVPITSTKPDPKRQKIAQAKGADSKKRKPKKKKDKNAPKKPMTAFMFFVNSQRETIKRENPGVAITEIAKIAGAKWRELSDSDKQPYNQKVAADKERYSRENAAYQATLRENEAGDGGNEG